MDLKVKLSNIQRELKAPKNLYNKSGSFKYKTIFGILNALRPFQKKYNVAFFLTDSVRLIGERYYVESTATIVDTESDERISTSGLACEGSSKDIGRPMITESASFVARKSALDGLLLLNGSPVAYEGKDFKYITASQAAKLKTCIEKHRDPGKCSLNEAIAMTCEQYHVKNLIELDTNQFSEIMEKMGETK